MGKVTHPVEQGGLSGGSAVELPLDSVWDLGEQEEGQAFVWNSSLSLSLSLPPPFCVLGMEHPHPPSPSRLC